MRFRVILAGMLIPAVMLGQNYRDALRLSDQAFYLNARALSMGNAYSTLGFDFTAVRANPSTLGAIDSVIYTMSVNFNAFQNSTTLFGTGTDFTSKNTTLSQFGIAFPISLQERNLVVALGYTQSQDYNRVLKYDGYNTSDRSLIQFLTSQNSPVISSLVLSSPTYDPITNSYTGDATVIRGNLAEAGFILEDGQATAFSLGFGYEVVYNIYFGVSANYITGRYRTDREFSETDSENAYGSSVLTNPSNPATADFRSFYYHNVGDLAFNGWDLKAGLLYRLENFIAIGASFRIPSHQQVSDIQYQEGYALYLNDVRSSLARSQTSTEYSVAPPYEVTAGASVNLWFVTATAEASYIDYSQIKYVSGFDLPDLTLKNKEFADKLRGALNLNGGAEVRLPFTGLSARAGFMFRQSPFKGAGMKVGRKYLTAGFGVNSGGRFAFDIGYALGWWNEILESYGVQTPNLSQTVYVHNVMMTMKLSL